MERGHSHNRCFRPRRGRWAADPRRVAAAGWIAALALVFVSSFRPLPMRLPEGSEDLLRPLPADLSARAAGAESMMNRAREELRRLKAGAAGSGGDDPSGLIGQELTPLVTTLGSLEAKRVSTNPAWARVLTERLARRGIGRGSLVAASYSGSFPALNLALALACEALDARLVAVSSVTASSWGANEPGFTWPEMEARLVEAGILSRPVSVAVTSGGAADRADDLAPEDRAIAERIRDEAAARLGARVLRPAGFSDAVALRLRAYRRAAAGRPIALYANVGGADASMGLSPAILALPGGFVPGAPFDASAVRGVTARMAEDGVPILMLLNVRELALRWGVPLSGG